MRISDVMIAGSLVAHMQRASSRLFRLQEQVSSGLAFRRPSENPPGAVQAAALRSGIAELTRYQSNCDQATSTLRMTEVALTDMSGCLREARDAALAMSPFDESGNQALADQVHHIITRIVSDANSVSEGRYLLSGFEVLTPPLVENPLGVPPYLYQGDRGDVTVQLSRSIKLTTSLDAAEVLNMDGAVDAGRSDALETLRQIEEALRAGDRVAIANGLTDSQWHLDRVLALRGEMGTRMQQVQMGKQRLGDGVLTLRDLLSEVQDVDIAEALIGLKSQEITYQAAAAAASTIHRASLLNYL
jgi:flagellar hook-associated protein 3 FlgL